MRSILEIDPWSEDVTGALPKDPLAVGQSTSERLREFSRSSGIILESSSHPDPFTTSFTTILEFQ